MEFRSYLKFSWQYGVQSSPWDTWMTYLIFLVETYIQLHAYSTLEKCRSTSAWWHLITVIQHKENPDQIGNGLLPKMSSIWSQLWGEEGKTVESPTIDASLHPYKPTWLLLSSSEDLVECVPTFWGYVDGNTGEGLHECGTKILETSSQKDLPVPFCCILFGCNGFILWFF